MEASGGRPERKPSKREMKSKSVTLPAGAVLMAHPGEGFFTKIRRCLRLRSKGKYDFNQTSQSLEAEDGSPSARHAKSSDSPVREENSAGNLSAKSSPHKVSRRSKSDKEEVILIRNYKRGSGVKVNSRILTEGHADEVLVVTIGEQKPTAGACGIGKSNENKASAISASGENKENDSVFDVFDPDYESLDDIRRRVRTGDNNSDHYASPNDLTAKHPKVATSSIIGHYASPDDLTIDQAKAALRQPLQVKTKMDVDGNGQGGGMNIPFSDRPGSYRESQAHSVPSSMMSRSAVFSDQSEKVRDSARGSSSLLLLNGVPAPSIVCDPMVTSTPSLNCSNSTLEEDDLYSNAKVMIRKKSQKQSHSEMSLSMTDQRSSGLFIDAPRSARSSLSPADFLAMMEAESSESQDPPPLPARNYSEEDLAEEEKPDPDVSPSTETLRFSQSSCSSQGDTSPNNETLKFSNSSHPNQGIASPNAETLKYSNSSNPSQVNGSPESETLKLSNSKHLSVSEGGELNSSVSSDTVCNGTGARPKTTKLNTFIDQGPVLTVNFNRVSVDTHNDKVPDTQSSLPDFPHTFTPGENIYEDIPDRTQQSRAQVPVETEEKKHEDTLMCADEDSSSDGDCGAEQSENSDLPDDVMIVSASDSMCGNDTDDSHGNSESTDVDVPQLPIQAPLSELSLTRMSSLETSAESDNIEIHQDKDDSSSKAQRVSHIAPKLEPFPQQNAKEAFPEHPKPTANATPAASSHPVSSSSSSSVSSSDTLNNLLDDEPDPDDFEGRHQSPPVGPPIHISHKQLLKHLEARTREEEVPPPIPVHQPNRRPVNPGAAARNVKSMEIPPGHVAEQESIERATPPSNNRRHSSSVSTASAHRDFLESMRQLKDCGWYWGPLSYEEAESKLADKCDGSFLVRDSSNENYILSLSFKSMGQVSHTRIEHHKGLFSFWSQPDSHGKAQICQFIEQTVENSRNGRFLYFLRPVGPGSPPLPIQLLYPVSRFCRVPSLQHMCRFLVLRRVRRDLVDHLPLPQKVKAYLLEKQYYVETLEED